MQKAKSDFIKYDDYLSSDHWKELKLKYKSSGKPWRCRICLSTRNINLHHRRYDTLGREDIAKDVIPLCGTCHAQVHWDGVKKTPLEYSALVHRENDLYRKKRSFWASVGSFRLGELVNKIGWVLLNHIV